MQVVDPHDAVQDNLWWALRGPQRLAGTGRPDATFDFDAAFQAGLTHLVSLAGATDVDCAPLIGVAHPLQDLYGGIDPANPSLEAERVAAATNAVKELLDGGHGVLVHCLGGTGRTGTVIGAVLTSYGADADEVAAWLDAVHRLRGRSGWPESPWQLAYLKNP